MRQDVKHTVDNAGTQSAADCRQSTSRWLLLVLTLFAAGFLSLTGYSFNARQQDTKACRMCYMYPSYKRLHGFDQEYTRFASKYGLYLYKDTEYDQSQELSGVPALFLPGNAGSYRQIRPIGSATAFRYDERLKNGDVDAGNRSLDFFTIDFNEDFSAFHGQTLLDQAEYVNSAIAYILSLYPTQERDNTATILPDAGSVILLAHSMGGIVARTLQIMPNYLPKSVNTIITMATPHAIPPAPFDPMIHAIYDQINAYWNTSFALPIVENPLKDVSIVSIVGGALDLIVSSDYATLDGIVPESNGFTVYTSAMPFVWAGADHQAILWCDQFRMVMADVLLDLVDSRSAGQTVALSERMRSLRQRLVSSLDRNDEVPPSGSDLRSISFSTDTASSVRSGEREVSIHKLAGKPVNFLFAHSSNAHDAFQLISSTPELTLFLCEGNISANRISTELLCEQSQTQLTILPSQDDLTEHGTDFSKRLYFVSLTSEHLVRRHVVVDAQSDLPDVLRAGFVSPAEAEMTMQPGLWQIFTRGVRVTFDTTHLVSFSLRLPDLVSSLLASTVKYTTESCDASEAVVRQHITDPIETKYYRGNGPHNIGIHGLPPFLPLPDHEPTGLNLQYFADTDCLGETELELQIDYVGSLGKLTMRYRLVLVAFSFALALAVVRLQLIRYAASAEFVSFRHATRLFVQSQFWKMLILATIVAYSLTFAIANRALDEYAGLFNAHRLLLGLQDPFFAPLVPILMLVSMGFLNLLSTALQVVLFIAAALCAVLARFLTKDGTELAQRGPIRRLITIGILLGIVAILVPFQFAFLVACLAQFFSAVRAQHADWRAGEPVEASRTSKNLANYNFSVLLLMLSVLPVNVPVLAAWIRNLTVQWWTPFASHHNVLMIAPIILLTESLVKQRMIEPFGKRSEILIAIVLAGSTTCLLLFGVLHPYLLHYSFNIVALLLVAHTHLGTSTSSAAGNAVKKGLAPITIQ